MPDVWATVAELDSTTQERMADVLETRGADMLSGTIGEELAAALKAEARRSAAAGGFFGHIAYSSVIARKPGNVAA